MKCPDPSAIGVKWCDLLARRRIREILDRRDDVAHRLLQIRLEVAVADDTLVGIEVYQDDRPVAKKTDLGNNRASQWHDHGPSADILQGQAILRHESNPFIDRWSALLRAIRKGDLGARRFQSRWLLLGSYRIATAPEPNSSRLTSFRSTRFDRPANNVGPWPASVGCTTNSYSSINPSSANGSGSFTPPTKSPLPDSRFSC